MFHVWFYIEVLLLRNLITGTMLRNNPMYSNNGSGGGSESAAAILNIDDRNHDYANGTVTIGIRLPSNLRGKYLHDFHYTVMDRKKKNIILPHVNLKCNFANVNIRIQVT